MNDFSPLYLRTRTLPCASCGEPVPRSVPSCARCDAERPSIWPVVGHAVGLGLLGLVCVAGFMAIGG